MLGASVFPDSKILKSLNCIQGEIHTEIGVSSKKLLLNHYLTKLHINSNNECESILNILNSNTGKLFVKALILKLLLN